MDWNTAQGLGLDSRRYSVVEGETRPPPGSASHRKQLPPAGEDEEDQLAGSCRSRPRTEGSSGSFSATELSRDGKVGEQEEEELRRLCQRCHIVTSQLTRQAATLANRTALKDPVSAAFLLGKLQRLQWHQPSRHSSVNTHCDVCGAAFHQLRRLALRRALGIRQEMTSHPYSLVGGAVKSGDNWMSNEMREKQQRHLCSYEDKRLGGTLWAGWGGVQSAYLGGGARRLATVTPLPLNTQQYLEGVWKVSCRPQPHLTTVSDADHVTEKTSNQDISTKRITSQRSQCTSAKTAFFTRAAQKLSLSRRKKPGPAHSSGHTLGPRRYTGGFSGALQLSPPAIPPCLLRAGSKVKDTPGMGKVRVMVRICSTRSRCSEPTTFLKVDGRRKQLALCEASAGSLSGATQRCSSSPALKTFTFDAVFSRDASQAEVSSAAAAEVIQSVVNGADGCIFSFGHANLGKTYTMIGRECSTQSLGVAPTAISWLFKVMQERKEKAGMHFDIRVSAVEISGRDEILTDLLAEGCTSSGGQQGTLGPSVSLQEDPIYGTQLQNQTELEVTSAERAAFFLDAALAARRSSQAQSNQDIRRNSHFLFVLHLHQERRDKSKKAAMLASRSRLHLLDLGSCETNVSRGSEGDGASCLSLSALGNVILALINGAKHVPYRGSKISMLLRESLGNINCRTTMIAHISDCPTNYMQTLTTVQLAARIHRTTNKTSKDTNSSSGGESSCEEGQLPRTPRPRLFHPHTVTSDPDCSSSSDYSCDTVIYIGPEGAAISDRELSDGEGPPAFIPLIPSLNKKQIKDAATWEGDHFKCDTFAELQERLCCMDGSEAPATINTAPPGTPCTQSEATKLTEATSPPKLDKISTQKFSGSTRTSYINKPEHKQFKFSLVNSLMDTSKWTCAEEQEMTPCLQSGELKLSDPFLQQSETFYLKGGVPKSSVSSSFPKTFGTVTLDGGVVCQAPPDGQDQQAPQQGQRLETPNVENTHHLKRGHMEVKHLQATLFRQRLDKDSLRTTVTVQQPVELNGEDELVFTIVEELPHGLFPGNGHPYSIFSRNCSAEASYSRPVSIISSINDEYDAYTSQQRASDTGADVCSNLQEMFSQHDTSQSSFGPWTSQAGNRHLTGRHLWDKSMSAANISTLSSPNTSHRETLLQQNVKSSLGDSGIGFSELDNDPSSSNKPSFIKCSASPESTQALHRDSSQRANNLNTSVTAKNPDHTGHSSLSRKTKSTSSASVECSRQKGRCDKLFFQGSSPYNPREITFPSDDKPSTTGANSTSCKNQGGDSNRVPQPPELQVLSSVERVVDSCETFSSRTGDTLNKLPQLTRGATTLGTVSVRHTSSDLTWIRESTSGTVRCSSLGKKPNRQRSSVIAKSGPASTENPVSFVRQSNRDENLRTVPAPNALKSSNDFRKSSLPNKSSPEEEPGARLQADSLNHKASSLKVRHGSARTLSSLKTRGTKADSSRHYGSLTSLERCDSVNSADSKPRLSRENSGASLEGNSRSNISGSRHWVPAFISPSSSAVSPGSLTVTSRLLEEVKGSNSSQLALSSGMKVQTQSASNSKNPSSSPKYFANAVGFSASLPSTNKSPARTGTGAKPRRGTITGIKPAISRAVYSRVSELSAGSQRNHQSRGNGSDRTDSGSPVNTLLPSPYSKMTAPRRPQHYSSGHGSDNSSILSGELPPAMGRTALFYHSGGSSGYESMIRDSETTGSASSALDSMSESGGPSSNRSRVSKSPKKRGNVFLRRRLIPTPLPDVSARGRKTGGQWVDLPPLKESFEIKVYEIDDMERVKRKREVTAESEGLQYANAKQMMLEKRRQQIRETKLKHERLKMELEEAKSRLMLHANKWSCQFDVDQDLDQESQEYLEALAQATVELELCLNLCKSRVMMETCFDIAVPTSGTTTCGGHHEIEV